MDDETGRTAWPVLASALAVVAVLTAVVTVRTWGEPDAARPSATPTRAEAPSGAAPATAGGPDVPVTVSQDLFVGGEQVPGRWYYGDGRGTRWIALRDDRTWWWGYDATAQRLEGEMDQPPVMSTSGGYVARVVKDHGGQMLIGADTEEGGEGFGGLELPGAGNGAPPRAVAVTDEGLVVARGARFQWLWRPLVDGRTIDLATTAPGQVVLGDTDAGLVVTSGEYDEADGAEQATPYLARLSDAGVLTKIVDLPHHAFLEASAEWMAYVLPGTVGGEAFTVPELRVQRLDGTASGALEAPEGGAFVAHAFRWESADRLLAVVTTGEDGDEELVRCRPATAECVAVALP